MLNATILMTKERSLYEKLIGIKSIKEICEKKHSIWYTQLKNSIKRLKKIKDENKQPIQWNNRELIALSVILLALIDSALSEELMKLNDETKPNLEKRVYEELNHITIIIPGIGKLNFSQKAYFLILAKMAEK